MKKVTIIVILILLALVVALSLMIRFPVSSTTVSYINEKLVNLVGIGINIRNVTTGLLGMTIEEVSYVPDFYAKDVSIDYEKLISFFEGKTNSITFFVSSNSFDFASFSKVIPTLGIEEEIRVEVATNLLPIYIDKIGNRISNLIENYEKDKSILLKYPEKFTSYWLDASYEISKVSLELSREVSKRKQEIYKILKDFENEVPKEYFELVSKNKINTPSHIFTKNFDQKLKEVRDNITNYEKEIDSISSKISLLNEGYKIAWDERVKMIKQNPESYFKRYISLFPYYLAREIANYKFIDLPDRLNIKNVTYTFTKESEGKKVKIEGFMLEGRKVFTEFFVTNESNTWNGIIKITKTSKDTTKIKNGKVEDLVCNFSFTPVSSLSGKLEIQIIPEIDKKELLYKTLTNETVINEILNRMTKVENLIDILLSAEVDNLLRSYKDQYKRYYNGILKDSDKVVLDFKKYVEKAKREALK